MFSQMFDTCLENSTVTVIKQLDNNSQEQRLNTLGELARTTEFIHFYVMSSSTQPNLTFIEALQHLISTRNNNQSATKKKPQNNNSPAKFKRIFGLSGLGKKPSNNNAGFMTTMEVVVVDVEFTPNQSNLSFVSECGFYFFPTQMYLTKSRLLRALGFVNAPSLFVVETAGLNVQSQAYRTLLDDRDGLQFPWPNPPLAELFKTEILRNSPDDGSIVKVDFTTLGKGVKGLFFGAKWCPPSRAMCKQLCEIYPGLKNEHQSFEIIFCSSDRSEESFREHFSSMPWFALPFGCEKQFSKAYDVQGIPTFLLLNDDFSLISRNGLHLLLSEPQNYPWKRKAIYELNEFTAQRLSELPALILFTEGSPEDTDFSIQFLESCADWIHNSSTQQKEQTADTGHTSAETASLGSEKPISLSAAADPLQIFYTGEDPICDYVLDSLGQEQADLPLLLICDVMAGHMVICEKPDVSEQVLSAFVADYRAGRAKVQPIPSPKQNQSRTVAGIPADMLQQMVSQEQLQTLPQPAESA